MLKLTKTVLAVLALTVASFTASASAVAADTVAWENDSNGNGFVQTTTATYKFEKNAAGDLVVAVIETDGDSGSSHAVTWGGDNTNGFVQTSTAMITWETKDGVRSVATVSNKDLNSWAWR